MNSFISENDISPFEDQNVSDDHIDEVKTWLISQFDSAGKHVPKFEYTLQSISHLHRLSKLSQANTRAALIVTNDLHEKSTEYSSQAIEFQVLIKQLSGMITNEAARIRELLENVGLGEENFPQNVKASIATVASVANLLNLEDTELSSFLIAYGQLSLKKTEVEGKRIRSQRDSQILLDRTRKAITKMANLKRILQELEDGVVNSEDEMRKWGRNLETLDAKENQYMKQQANFKELLSRVGYTPDISHRVLVEMSQHKNEMEESTIPILETLRRYRNLPPDTSLAASAVEEKAREYEIAEQYLEDLLLSALETSD